jgi:hypothetical protein
VPFLCRGFGYLVCLPLLWGLFVRVSLVVPRQSRADLLEPDSLDMHRPDEPAVAVFLESLNGNHACTNIHVP